MKKNTFHFSNSSTDYYFAGSIAQLKTITDQRNTVLITDENVFNLHTRRFKNWNTIVLKPGEAFKIQPTVDSVINQLIEMQAGRNTTLVGIGGGVITDITGYVASVYMRGIRFGFIPTTLLALVDASIGGKNGIDVGLHKNMVGTIRQPSFIFHDLIFLNSLPDAEWQNGFAEIIKHACIKEAAMFKQLEKNTFKKYQQHKTLAGDLIRRNAILKIKTVQEDEFEAGNRKLLNFGHTLGHALENQYDLSHGQAVSIGMAYATKISNLLLGFKQSEKVTNLLAQYHLPTFSVFDKQKAFAVLKMDKKREQEVINYILLEKIGKGIILPIPLSDLEEIINQL